MPPAIYKTPEGEAEIAGLYEEALADLDARFDTGVESTRVDTRFGETHVLTTGPKDAPPAVFLPGGNFLNPICLKWFMPLAGAHRLYSPDIVGQPGRSAPRRPSPKGDGHAQWLEDVLDGLGLEQAALVGLSYGAGVAIRVMGHAPERVSQAALVSPAAIAAGPIIRMLPEVVVPMFLYRLRPTGERLWRAAEPLLTEPDELTVRQLGAVYRQVRLDTGLPRMATGEEVRNFKGPVAVFACEEDVFFPARRVLARAREIFPNIARAECLEGCRHVPSREALARVNEHILEFLSRAAMNGRECS